MNFEEQITDIELVIDINPKTYIKWRNTEYGRDKSECYERIESGKTVVYVNYNNRNSSVICGHPFFDILENIYNDALKKQILT